MEKDFLQSSEWREFQKSAGRRVFCLEAENFYVSIIEHTLPIVGKYFYVPRGPVGEISNFKFQISNKCQNQKLESRNPKQIQNGMRKLIDLAKKEKIGWIRIEPATEEMLENIKAWTSGVQMHSGHLKIVKAPHDMQPREIFVIDITKSEEELLAEMKSKTRYNIKLAEKKGVKINLISNSPNSPDKISNKQNEKCISEFLRLVRVTAKRDGIVSHPEEYYRKMLETIPGGILKLYTAEYQGKIIAANLVSFYGGVCTYLHGASDNENRNVMAPFLLQWQQIKDAKRIGCNKYDFGGISTQPLRPDDYIGTPPLSTGEGESRSQKNSWAGITRFKMSFSPKARPVEFPGSYDIILNRKIYFLYKVLQKIKSIF